MSKTREDERKEFVWRCLKEYYKEDRTILIDPSICTVYSAKYIISALMHFGNKIIISEEDFDVIVNWASNNSKIRHKQIRAANAQSILNRVKKNYTNISIVTLPAAASKLDELEKFLKENPDILLYVENENLYQKLIERGLRKQLYCMHKGMKHIEMSKTNHTFETIGAIKFEKDKMLFYPKEMSKIKVFNSSGIEKCGDVIEVKQRDFILIKSIEEDGSKKLALYEIVSRHTRNQASLILRTFLTKEESSNFFIKKLPYMLQNIMING